MRRYYDMLCDSQINTLEGVSAYTPGHGVRYMWYTWVEGKTHQLVRHLHFPLFNLVMHEAFPKSLPVRNSQGMILRGAILITIFVNATAALYQLYLMLPYNQRSLVYTYIGSDHPNCLPVDFGAAVAMKYSEDPDHFRVADDPVSVAEWEALLPPGRGHVFLGPYKRAFAVTMFHQLHCLNLIRIGILEAGKNDEHLHHCLDYLRQLLLCAADVTLESDSYPVVLNWGVPHNAPENATHICRDWTKVYDHVNSMVWGTY